MICTYILNCLLECRTCIHFGTYMFLCNYDVFLSIESLCWIVSNTCYDSETKNQRLGILYTQYYILCSLLLCITSQMPHLQATTIKKKGRHYFKMQ